MSGYKRSNFHDWLRSFSSEKGKLSELHRREEEYAGRPFAVFHNSTLSCYLPKSIDPAL